MIHKEEFAGHSGKIFLFLKVDNHWKAASTTYVDMNPKVIIFTRWGKQAEEKASRQSAHQQGVRTGGRGGGYLSKLMLKLYPSSEPLS